MSRLLRLPVVLLVALAMALLWAWPATADDPPPPTADECLAVPAPDGCPAPSDPLVGDDETGAGGEQPGREQAAAAEAGPTDLLDVPNCDALPGVGLPPCAPPACDSLPLDLALPDCAPAPPPTCENLPELPGLPFCQFPDSDCPPPVPTGTASAAATDGECTPPLTCDQFAQLFGFGDDCGDIPLCIPRDQVPEGFPIPVPAPPLCGPGAGPTPPTTGGGSNKPPTSNPPAVAQNDVYYQNCDDARAKGAAPVYRGQPGYRAGLDSDNDGIGCEVDAAAVTPAATQSAPTGKLAYTGVDLEPLLRLAAILVSSGTLLVLAGQRRT